MHRRAMMATAIAFFAASAHADVLINQTFSNVAGLSAQGWILSNLSSPVGTTGWFQGDSTIFGAQAGAAESYIAANFNSAAAGGVINDWLISPTFSTAAAGTISFWVRGAADPGYIDTLAYGFAAGSSGATSNFTNTTTIAATGTWTQYSLAYAAQGAGSVGRFAINYFGSADRADYIGIDTLAVVNAVPEPSTWLTMALGVAGVATGVRRRRARTTTA